MECSSPGSPNGPSSSASPHREVRNCVSLPGKLRLMALSCWFPAYKNNNNNNNNNNTVIIIVIVII